MGCNSERNDAIPKPVRSSDCGLYLARMKLDSVVIVFQNSTVNMPLLLAHTARQTILVGGG